MSATYSLESTIRISRLVRAGVDICVLVTLLGLFIHLKFLSDSHHAKVQGSKYISHALSKAKPHSSENMSVEHIEEFHDSEPSMWASFFEWQSKTNHAAGSCWFTSPNEQHPGKFRLLCSGENAQPGVPINAEPMQILVENKNGHSNSKADNSKLTTQKKFAVKPPIVRGWLDTPTGRKHFDPVAKRWKP